MHPVVAGLEEKSLMLFLSLRVRIRKEALPNEFLADRFSHAPHHLLTLTSLPKQTAHSAEVHSIHQNSY